MSGSDLWYDRAIMEVSAAIQTSNISHRAERLGITVRRLLRRGARKRISKMLAEVRAEDVAVMLRAFTPGEQFGLFRILIDEYSQAASDVLVELEPETRLAILEQMSPAQVAKLLDLAATDDAVFLLESLPAELKDQVLEIVDLEERFSEVQARLTYEDDTAGRIMDSEFVALEEETAASDAIAQVRRVARDVDMISYLYVVDKTDRLIGVTPLRQLLLAEPEADPGRDHEFLGDQGPHLDRPGRGGSAGGTLRPAGDPGGRRRRAAGRHRHHRRHHRRLQGGGHRRHLQDGRYLGERDRLPGSIFEGGWDPAAMDLVQSRWVVARRPGHDPFRGGLRQRPVGTVDRVRPRDHGHGGQYCSQTSTIAVRGLATGRLSLGQGHVRHFLWQQVKVGALLGTICSLVVAIVAFAYGKNPWVSLAVGSSLFVSVQLASFNGVLIPVAFQRIGFDPAVASGPLVTTANDVLGVIVYFLLASLLFNVLSF